MKKIRLNSHFDPYDEVISHNNSGIKTEKYVLDSIVLHFPFLKDGVGIFGDGNYGANLFVANGNELIVINIDTRLGYLSYKQLDNLITLITEVVGK
jgi:hypothetical protein